MGLNGRGTILHVSPTQGKCGVSCFLRKNQNPTQHLTFQNQITTLYSHTYAPKPCEITKEKIRRARNERPFGF